MARSVVSEAKLVMGAPAAISIVLPEGSGEADAGEAKAAIAEAFALLERIEDRFSPYRPGSELCRINRGEEAESQWSPEMREVMRLSELTKQETGGYFDVLVPEGERSKKGRFDTSGMVKGWAIKRAADQIASSGWKDFYVDVGGDIEARGAGPLGAPWRVGIQDPFDPESDRVAGASSARRVVKTVALSNRGIATSGTYNRGQHIRDPHRPGAALGGIVSVTVIAPDACEADRFATAAFAMQQGAAAFLEGLRPKGFEGYVIAADGTAVQTSGFDRYKTA